jgi:CRISPR-associated protein Csb2
MPSYLCITIRFLDPSPSFHGKCDGEEPEWPPSPLRLFQALVDGAASLWRNRQFNEHAAPALEWFQSQQKVTVVAPNHKTGIPFRMAVPNNDLDVWAGPVSRGAVPKKQPNELKTLKPVRPTHLLGDTLHYLFHLPNGQCPHLETLQSAARSITHLGWGIDMVAGDASVITSDEADKLPGHRWRETPTGGVPLRVPMAGTLDDLMRKHQDFLQRISEDGFRPVPPLRAFRVARYHSATVASSGLPARPWCAFGILKPDFSRNAAFNTVQDEPVM